MSTSAAVELKPDGGATRSPRIPDALLGTALFVFCEAMFFVGLVSAFFVLRNHASVWPPEGQPRLPVLITGLNSIALLASAYTMRRARAEHLDSDRPQVQQWLLATFLLGATFLVIQGYEWFRLIQFGLTTVESLYGGLFYVLIGSHALHVAGALVALWLVMRRVARGAGAEADGGALAGMRLFWYFVVGVWPVLYVSVYLY